VEAPLDFEAEVVAALEDDPAELYDNAPCGYLSTLPDGTIVKVNQTFLTWTGFARDDLVGRRKFHRLLTPGGQIYFETHFAPLLAMQGAVREIALELVVADGKRRPVLVNAVVKQGGDGHPLAVRITIFDASDRRRYERELLRARRAAEASAGRLRALQEVTAELATVSSVDGVAAVVARAAAEALGTTRTGLHLLGPGGDLEPPAGPGGDPACARALVTGEPVVRESPDEVAVVTPLGAGQRAGVVVFGFAAGRAVAQELPLLRALAGMAGQAVERTRLYEETVERARRSSFLARLSRELDEASGVAGRAQRCVEMLVDGVAAWARLEPAPDGPGRVSATATGPAGTTNGEFAAALDRQVLARVAAGDPAALRDSSWAVLPLSARGHRLGALALLARQDRPFRRDDLPFLTEIADRAALALENARLYEQERDSALTLQRSLLAGDPPRHPRCELVTRYRPAVEWLEVGGDWYDAFDVGDDRIGVVVGDVVGRGIRAASTMGQMRSALRAVAGGGVGPARLLEQLDVFVERMPDGQLTTLAYVEVEPAARLIRLACAGHPPPILLTAGAAEPIWSGRSLPLGPWGRDMPRTQEELVLPPGARLLLYSDGLVERPGERIDAGIARLVRAMVERAAEPLPEMVDGMLAALLGDGPSHDDVCVLALAIA
jgi:serine/threonine-protein kinase RsbW